MNIPLSFVEKASAFEEIVVYLSETALSMEKMSLPYEVWRAVVGYEGYYEVSNFGRVKSLERIDSLGRVWPERILRPANRGKGYLAVSLSKDGKKKMFLVHRLVGMAFPDMVGWTKDAKGRPFSELDINHKREKEKANNHVSNLEWCDCKYNHDYGTHNERVAKANTNGKCSKCVAQKTLDGEFVQEWPSLIEIHRQMGWSISSISACCLDKRKSAYGFLWSYTKDFLLF